jgi:CRP-like cAMP-binding protein
MTLTGTLKETELFGGLSGETLQAIAGFSTTRDFDEGDNIYSFGDDAEDLYLVDRGRVRFSMGVGNRPQDSGSIMTSGSVFGWAAVLDEQPRRVATAACLEDSRVIVIPGGALLDLFAENTQAGYLVMRRLATMITRDFLSVMSV